MGTKVHISEMRDELAARPVMIITTDHWRQDGQESRNAALQDDGIAWRYWLDRLDSRATRSGEDAINAMVIEAWQLAKFHKSAVSKTDKMAYDNGLLLYVHYRVIRQSCGLDDQSAYKWAKAAI